MPTRLRAQSNICAAELLQIPRGFSSPGALFEPITGTPRRYDVVARASDPVAPPAATAYRGVRAPGNSGAPKIGNKGETPRPQLRGVSVLESLPATTTERKLSCTGL